MLLQRHIDKLATELNTEVHTGKDTPGMMFVEYEPPMIEGPALEQPDTLYYPSKEIRYLVLLHELGHVAHGHTQGRPPFEEKTFYFDNGVLKSEAEAWEYALDEHIQKSLDLLTRQFIWERCLNSYYRGSVAARGKPSRLSNGNRHHVEFIWDKPDDFFWSIKERILG